MAWVDVPNSNSVWEYENTATASNTYSGAAGTYSGGIRSYTRPGTGTVEQTYARCRKKGQQNLLNYSEQFDNGYWSTLRSTLTVNATTDPNGTTTAEKFIQAAGQTGNGILQLVTAHSVTADKDYTLSIFAKKGDNRNFLCIKETMAKGGGGISHWYNLDTGVVGGIGPASGAGTPWFSTAAIRDEGNGWYRCSVSFTADATRTGKVMWTVAENDSNNSNTDDQGFIYIWGAMFTDGKILTPYKKAEASISTLIERGEVSKTFFDAQ
jgi:hypothetical protein